jgi:hypothetical protein
MRPRHINLPLEVVPGHENFFVWVSAVFLNCDFIFTLVTFLSIKLFEKKERELIFLDF